MAELHLPHAGGGQTRVDEAATAHEASDVDIKGVFGFAFGLLATMLVVSLVVWVLFAYFQSLASRRVAPEFPLAAEQQNRLPPEPRLQTNPRQDLIEFRRQEDQILNSYGWVDRNAGIVRIPVDQAIKLTLQHGLPTRQERQ